MEEEEAEDLAEGGPWRGSSAEASASRQTSYIGRSFIQYLRIPFLSLIKLNIETLVKIRSCLHKLRTDSMVGIPRICPTMQCVCMAVFAGPQPLLQAPVYNGHATLIRQNTFRIIQVDFSSCMSLS